MDEQEINTIHSIPLFSALPLEVLDDLIREGRLRIMHFPTGNIIHVEGDRCTHVDLIINGRLAIERIDYSGSLLAIAQFSRHDILGGNLVYSAKSQYPWTITSQEATTLARISGEDLFAVMCGYPEVLTYFLRMISENTQVLNEKITAHLNRSARERISNYLFRESERQKNRSLSIPYSKTRLAEMLGIQRTSLSRELARMRDDGLLEFQGRKFKLLQLEDDAGLV